MDKQERITTFQKPGSEYRAKPFWSWNGELRKEEVRRQIGIMKEMGLGGYFMHSRAGLITEYLGEDWFDCINAGADEGERLGMEAWLYDEDRWPSGSAGGKVTIDPQYSMKSLVLREQDPETFAWQEDTLSAFRGYVDGINLYGYAPLSRGTAPQKASPAPEKSGKEKVLSFSIVPDQPSSGYNGTTYIDTMSRKAVDRFIELTHEQYAQKCGNRMGRTIKGIFTDEPHRGHAMDNLAEKDGMITCAMAWTDDFFAEFEKRYGYRAEEKLPELFYRLNGEPFAPIKHDWFDLADNLFLERFAMPINDWCKAHGIDFTGHVLHEDSMTNQSVPQGSLMRFYEYQGCPGVDVLTEGNRCYWIVKQLASSARQTGKKSLLSELYGCTGWQFPFKAHKAVGDWQALFGINLRCPHLSWYTMEGESKRDYPASILHQSTWYPYYGAVEDYFSRFGVFMTEGTPLCDVLVLNPIESVWSQSYLGWAQWIMPVSPEVQKLEEHYATLFHMLTGNHIDFDYGEEQMMARLGSVELKNGTPYLRIGKSAYKTVVISGAVTIRPTTLALLRVFLEKGGKVIFSGTLPSYVDAVPSDEPALLAQQAVCVPFEEKALVSAVRAFSSAPISVIKEDGTPATDVFVQLRNYGDSVGFVLLNTDRENPRQHLTIKFSSAEPLFCERWIFENGLRYDANAGISFEKATIKIPVPLPAGGTAAFVLTHEKDTSLLPYPEEKETLSKTVLQGDFSYTLSEKNVCVLDFARYRFANGPWSREMEILKADSALRDEAGLEHRGGEMLQPWYAKLHDTKIYGNLTLCYDFTIDTLPQDEVFLAGERPERMHYSINGRELVSSGSDDFWVDDCFKKMPIPKDALKIGKNTVTVTTEFMRTTNLEALYLVGAFGVRIDGHRRTITALPERISNGNLDQYALPFYTGEVTYRVTPDMYRDVVKKENSARILLLPEAFTGALIKVGVEGEAKEQLLCWEPYEADVTDAVKNSKTLLVTVVGTRRNLFGPLHLVPALQGAYGPEHFVTDGDTWSEDYVLIDSALTGIILKVKK